ncbi:hypothetical protein Rt10032_c16g5698 [Rhodotorula toruloides]|uniref:MARVEL domain-containing protein n=1 Tax=Rhodotorula toruloides TaxID=5286 RepID=A0A511KMU8_RHOTO|nr:hypothetical protein Rt10032_c16g5698 [Rhodotorula toruloides]
MVSERTVRLVMGPFAGFTFIASVITMSIAASLEAHWQNVGFPNKSYRDRERILLAAGIWGIIISTYSLVGTIFAPGSTAFGIFPHLIAFSIAFILYLVGAASLTALTDKVTCSNAAETFSRCNTTKALVAFGWIGTIFVFLILVFVSILGVKARSGVGARKGALTDA